ncbi:MAG: 4-hydroxy-tetrahydrodipicolinate synthase [Candidatus Omnitrophica bacterium]|nr:4-hydroxy-tetrahydrodipicolinate synthase [Candidatus Omnitrophota bacterium]MCF7877832.1 4-hydroxy-tetrahydrodipicolinate synthase [Candidatus Omnitrophota bacterium]MCF7878185.1 4-hydroxy-tetrahydrodipicolinate synthase [Candidatus Omnitrophota bacterium]MCF7893428.1 4-hydroxy-tetrahydrodipicolinate synthase [Candidatus Omnitrophota bacterium]
MLQGSMVALVTPFKKDGSIDEDKLKFLIDWHIKNKTDGILVCGTTGESATLTHQEHKRVVSIAVEQAKKKIPIIAGAGSNSTDEALDLTRYAKKAGADYSLVITPYYNKPTQRGLSRHFKKIADAVNIPIIIYNVPSRTGVNISPETVVEIAGSCKNVVGIKEASGSLDQATAIMSRLSKGFSLFSGNDQIILPMMSLGASGVISVVANIEPKETHQLVQSFLKGDIKKSRKIQFQLYDLIQALFVETNPIPVKAALNLMGLIEGNLRLPLCKMDEKNLTKLKKTLKEYRLIK